jgi:hypothetical protein
MQKEYSMWNLYEDPWLPLIIGIVVLIIGVWIRNNVAEKKGLWLILLGVLIGVGGFGLDYAVATDYEQIQAVIYTCRDAAIARDIRRIEPLISPSYQDRVHFNRDRFIGNIDSVFKTAAISRVKFQEIAINLFGATGRAAIRAAVFLDPNSSYAAAGGLFFVEVSVDFRRDHHQWTVAGVEVETVNNDRVNWKAAQ